MKAKKNDVITFHYDLSQADGDLRETSREGDGLAVLVGHRNVILGVDEALVGRAAGDKFEVTVSPEKAYGMYQDDLTQRVSKKHLVGKPKPKVGDTVVLQTKQGYREVTVTKVGGSVVDVNLNHPMAGKTLTFKIEVLDVREASAEELAHRHVHGPGGHQH